MRLTVSKTLNHEGISNVPKDIKCSYHNYILYKEKNYTLESILKNKENIQRTEIPKNLKFYNNKKRSLEDTSNKVFVSEKKHRYF
jgi:hypothetical protein